MDAYDSDTPAQRAALVRKYAKSLKDRTPPLLDVLRVRDPMERERSFVHYRLALDRMVYWPGTAVYVLQLVATPLNANGAVDRADFETVLRKRFLFDEKRLTGTFKYTCLRSSDGVTRPEPNYVIHYPDEGWLRPSTRVYEELEYIKLVARHYDEDQPSTTSEVEMLIAEANECWRRL